MSKENNNAPAVAPHALQDFINCPHWGKGGRFIYDPATNTRTRVEPEPDASENAPGEAAQAPAAQAQQVAAPAETTTTIKKERSRA